MAASTFKDETTLAWMETREKALLQGRQILRRVMNEAIEALRLEYQDALLKGELVEFVASQDELKRLLLKAAKAELTA